MTKCEHYICESYNKKRKENLERVGKLTGHHAWLWRDSKLLLSSMNALDKAKPQGKELVQPEQISPILQNVQQTATWQTNRIDQTRSRR